MPSPRTTRTASQFGTLEDELARSADIDQTQPVVVPSSPIRSSTRHRLQASREESEEQPGLAASTSQQTTQNIPNRIFIPIRSFLTDLVQALVRVLVEVAWPLLCSAVHLGLSCISPKQPSHEPLDTHRFPSISSTAQMNKHFGEHVKYLICTSFLLTPSLSISLYDSEASSEHVNLKETAAKDHAAELNLLASAMPDPQTRVEERVACYPDLPGRIPSPTTSTASTAIPPLVGLTRNIRDASLCAIASLFFTTNSWDTWFRLGLLITSLAWSAIVAQHVVSGPPSLVCFTTVISPQAAFNADEIVAIIRRRKSQSNVVDCTSGLIASAREADKAFNKVLSAIQEVELVSRGFKISHPLPPISRIEAAATTLSASPMRQRYTPEPHATPADGPLVGGLAKVSRSASAASHDSNMKHGELNSGEKDKESGHGGARGPAEIRRMSHLRGHLRRSIDEAKQLYRAMIDQLSPLVDSVELSALRDVYSLDSDASESLASAKLFSVTASLTDSRGPSPLPTSSSMTGTLSGDDSFVSNASSMQKRSSWTLPRSAGVTGSSFRSQRAVGAHPADMSFDESFSSHASPRALQNAHKRFSLTSDGSAASVGATAPVSRNGSMLKQKLSRQDSNGSDTTGLSGSEASTPRSAAVAHAESSASKPKGSRLSYIAEGSNINGPNTSPAAKRLSYQSSDSRPGSQLSQNRRDSLDVAAKAQGSPISSWGGSLRRRGVTGSIGGLAGLGVDPNYPQANVEDQVDGHTLLGLKSSFEQLHNLRRRALCHLLALQFSRESSSPNAHAYWDTVATSMNDCTSGVDRLRLRMSDVLGNEMSGDYWERRPPTDHAPAGADPAPARNDPFTRLQGLLNVPGSSGLVPFTGFEDKTQALALSIRSIQVKLRACAEELQMGMPNSLHGVGLTDGGTAAIKNGVGSLPDADVIARKESAERIWDTLKEDIISLSQEWEAGSKILRAEKRRGAAIGPSSPTLQPTQSGSSDLADLPSESSNGIVLESPLEADEDAAGRGIRSSYADRDRDRPGPAVLSADEGQGGLPADVSEHDLAALLLSSTSPAHLPRPGLEQVYESVSGLPSTNGSGMVGADGRKMTREERIQKVKEQRDQVLLRQRQQQHEQKTGGTQAHAGVVTELKGVLEVLRSQRMGGGVTTSDASSSRAGPIPNQQAPPPSSSRGPMLASPFHSTDIAPSATFGGTRPAFSSSLSGSGRQGYNQIGDGGAHDELESALANRANASQQPIGSDTVGGSESDAEQQHSDGSGGGGGVAY